jgi:hypothetical protein
MGAAAASLLLAGCADEGYYGTGPGYGYDYYGPSDVWYDGYYGPYVGGYWDSDIFVFTDRGGRRVRDSGGHFRRERFEGAQRYQSSPRHDRDRDRDDR